MGVASCRERISVELTHGGSLSNCLNLKKEYFLGIFNKKKVMKMGVLKIRGFKSHLFDPLY